MKKVILKNAIPMFLTFVLLFTMTILPVHGDEELIEFDYGISVDETIYTILDEYEEDLERTRSSKERLENDTLETDLFNLIDSMYENKEEGE